MFFSPGLTGWQLVGMAMVLLGSDLWLGKIGCVRRRLTAQCMPCLARWL